MSPFIMECSDRLLNSLMCKFDEICEINARGPIDGDTRPSFVFSEESPVELYGEVLRFVIQVSMFYKNDGLIDLFLSVERPQIGYQAKRLFAYNEPAKIRKKLFDEEWRKEVTDVLNHLKDEILYHL